MITPSEITNVVMLCITLAMWSIFLFNVVPEYRLDAFRQKMFSVRDDLFDFAAAGNIGFSDPAYILLRRQMNGFIRYGHQLTVFRLLMSKLLNLASGESNRTEWHDAWSVALENLHSDDVRARLKAFHHQSSLIAFRYLFLGSPLLWMAVIIVGIGLLSHGAALRGRQLIIDAVKKVMVGPLDRRQIEEAAAACAH